MKTKFLSAALLCAGMLMNIAQAASFLPDSSGLVSIEVEHFTAGLSRGGHGWQREPRPASDFSGQGTLRALPEDAVNISTNYAAKSPRLDYAVAFATTGIHYVWVRGRGPGGGSNSVHAGLNGQQITSAANLTMAVGSGYGWIRGSFEVPSAGVRTVNLWMRESGTIIDKLVVTPSATFTPTGKGPAESSQGETQIVATPTITPAGGTFNQAVTVQLASATVEAVIHYTLNGSEPTSSSTLYSAPFALTQSATLKAIAMRGGFNNSSIASAAFIITANANTPPTLNPIGNKSTQEEQAISFTVTATDPETSPILTASDLPSGARFDGAIGAFNWTPATGATAGSPYSVTFTATDATDSRLTDSESITITVTANEDLTVARPTITPAGGTFADSVTVELATTTAGAGIYYTLDGSNPTTSSTLYSVPFALIRSAIFKAIGTREGFNNSLIAGAAFTITTPDAVPRYGVFEKSFNQASSYANAYTAVTATATLTAPDGAEKAIPLFWDGGNVWKLRFSPNAVGNWTWIISSDDAGLNGQFGSFACVSSANKGGIRKHSTDPYHFERENGEPFWWFGDTNWSAFANNSRQGLDRAAVLHYIDVRAEQGFDYIHIDILNHIALDDGPNFPAGSAFASIAAETLNPDFFDEMDLRLQYMNSKGITSGLVLAWSNAGWNFFASDVARRRYARYVVARYSAYNVTFIVSGEWQRGGLNNKPRYVAIGNEVTGNDPHDRMITIHSSGQTRYRSVEEFNSTSWMSFGDYQQNYDALHAEILDSRDHEKPVVNAEYAYYLRDIDGDGVVDKANSASRTVFRNAAYDILLAGGYFVTGFGTTYAGGGREPGPFNVDAAKNDVAENDLVNMRRLFTSTKWWLLQPNDSLVTGPGTHYCLAEAGKQYLAYVRNTSAAISLSLGGALSRTYEVKRFDPQTGAWTALPDYTGVGPVELTPANAEDWVFQLKEKN